MPADADAVFDIVADLANMTWLPPGVEIELPGPGLLRLWIRSDGQDRDVERPLRIDWERLRIEWGSDTTVSYTGSIQVLRLAPDTCSVAVGLTGPRRFPRALVDAWIDDALEALAAEVHFESTRA